MKPDKNKHNIQSLSDIPQKHNFEIPKDYFKTVEETVLSEITLKKILIKEKDVFEIPENYLETLEATVIAKLQSELLYKEASINTTIPEGYFDTIEDSVFDKLPKKGKLFQLKTILKSKFTPIAIAASLLLIFTLGNINKANAVTFENISSTDIELWVENGDLVFSMEDFTEQVTDTALELNNFSNIYTDEQALDFLKETHLENILFND